MTINSTFLLNKAKLVAAQSSHFKRMGAIIFNPRTLEILSQGFNQPLKGFRPLNHILKDCYTLHAEAAALADLLRRLSKSNYPGRIIVSTNPSVLIVRLGSRDNLLLAKPCATCRRMLFLAGFKTVYYSTNSELINKIAL